MLQKVLIANRGEIAVRIMRTARRMGIATVAVYSDADEDALHVRTADEAVRIGPPPALESYLRIDRIIEAARETGAEAVHPGYGFLSENPAFVEALDEAGIGFVGPPASAIAAMGDKIVSKQIAESSGVSVIPGHPDAIEEVGQAVTIAKGIGYPVMIKAAAGGGGKGMRVAANEDEVREGYARCRSEARSSFGDDRVFIEKFVARPRHIEIQVLADRHGAAVHFGERDCSIQRRNQKVVEEAPSPFLDADTRARMGEQAVQLARAVNYAGAGTVEFVVDADRQFYFLEMNARLQVEHPVTELVHDVDLVEEMLRIAAGEPLRFRQSEIGAVGWALEARVYAEDPFRSFLPSIGRISRYAPPVTMTGEGIDVRVRLDAGVGEGDQVSLHYDPMIGKLCTGGPDRAEALRVMREALDEFVIEGISHNVPFLSAVMDHPDFVSGDFDTGFMERVYPEGFAGVALAPEDQANICAICALLRHRLECRAGRASGYRPSGDWVVRVGEVSRRYVVLATVDGRVRFEDGTVRDVKAKWRRGFPLCRARVDDASYVLQLAQAGEAFRISYRGARIEATVRTRRRAELAEHMPSASAGAEAGALLCPMPGLVVSIDVKEGDRVEAGQALATVEAMKMENVLRAERAATIARIAVAPGATLAVDDVVLEFA